MAPMSDSGDPEIYSTPSSVGHAATLSHSSLIWKAARHIWGIVMRVLASAGC